jgi:hypothetical protein
MKEKNFVFMGYYNEMLCFMYTCKCYKDIDIGSIVMLAHLNHADCGLYEINVVVVDIAGFRQTFIMFTINNHVLFFIISLLK